jgi:hypothetical protein
MGLLQTPTSTPVRLDDIDGEARRQHPRPRFAGLPAGDEPADGRHEPQALCERMTPADPYAAWLEQREAEAELQREGRPQIRLVHRPRGGGGPGIVARRL